MYHKAGRSKWVLQNGPDSHLFYTLLVIKTIWNQPHKTISWFQEFLGQHKAFIFPSSTKENYSGVVAMKRAPVVSCPPQLMPPHFSDKGGLKPNLIPTPTISVKNRPYSPHSHGLRHPCWHTPCYTLFQRRVAVILSPSPITENQQGFSGIICRHRVIHLISRWQKATVAQLGLENTASDSPSPSQDHAGAAAPSFLPVNTVI